MLYAQSAVRTKPPGRGWWNYDVLITDRRVAARKSGWAANIAKGIAKGAGPAAGLAGAQALGALGSAVASAAAATALSASMGHASVPRWHDAKSSASAEIDEFLAGGKEPVQYPCAEIAQAIFRKGGFLGTPALIVRTAAGDFTSEVEAWKDLQPVLRELLGARCQAEG